MTVVSRRPRVVRTRPIDAHVIAASGGFDVRIEISDPDVTVAEVFDAIGMPVSGNTVDGVCPRPDDRAADVLVVGSTIARQATCDGEPGPNAQPAIEVAIVAGLDAGRVQPLAAGRYHFGGFYLAVDGHSSRDPLTTPGSRPWFRGASSLDVIMVGAGAITLGPPIDPQAGTIGYVHRPPRRLAPEATMPEPVGEMPAAVGEPAPLSWAAVLAPVPVALLMAVLFRPLFAVFAAMGPLVAIGRFVEARRRYQKELRLFDQRVEQVHAQIDASRALFAQSEARRRWLANPHVGELWRRASLHSRRLWERRPGTPGYLTFTLGVAPMVLDEPLADPVVLAPVPHVADLVVEQGVGFHGDRESCLAMARSAILQLATLHGPGDLRIAVLCEARRASEWDWLKWLPHVSPDLVAKRADELASALAQWPERGRSTGTKSEVDDVCLVIVDDPTADIAALKAIAQAGQFDIRVIALAPVPTQLPAACTSLVAASRTIAEIVSPQSLGDPVLVCPTGVSGDTAVAWSRSLAPMIDPERSELPRSTDRFVSLLQLVGLESSAERESRWAHRSADHPPTAVIGVDDGGASFVVDLDSDGPHTLIAGTTGSGKSELLRTLVVSLANEAPPWHLNFVLVDFKGGGAFDACNRLPHIAGLITDLDEHLVERALTSLRAELQRREQLFRSLGASDHSEATRRSDGPLPRLVIVIDEFAALASDYPDLLTSIIDLAARGRSLGMHLVLATQRPSGVVDQKIRANTNLRIALRVQDGFDSQDVVGVADAAHIDRASPGRAIVSIGGDRPVTMQSAYAAAPDQRAQRCTVVPYELFSGAVATASPANAAEAIEPIPTELQVLVDAIDTAAAVAGCRAPQLWSDPLPERLPWAALQRKVAASSADDAASPGVAVGLVDVPDAQRQQPWYWNPDSGPLVLFGASTRTCAQALMSVAYGCASMPSDETHLYVIDGDAGNVSSLMELPTTGAYVSVHETDRIERTLGLFEQELDARRRTSDVAATRLVVLIDNLASVLSRFDDMASGALVDRLAALARDGSSQRLHVVLASRTVRDVPHRLVQQFPNRLTAELADPNAYLTLGLRTRDMAPLPPMRAIDVSTGRLLQLVEPPESSDVAGSPEMVRDPERVPSPVGSFPLELAIGELPAASTERSALVLPLGIEAIDLEPASLRLEPGEHALIVGHPGAGRSTTLVTIARQVERGRLGVRLLRVAGQHSLLSSPTMPGELVGTADVLLADREASERVLILVDDAERLADELVTALSVLISATERTGPSVVVASTIEHARSLRSWLGPVRSGGRGVLLGATPGDGDLFKVRLEAHVGNTRVAGRGHLVSRGHVLPLQIANAPSP